MYFAYTIGIVPSEQENCIAETEKQNRTLLTERKSSNLKQLGHILCLRRESSAYRYYIYLSELEENKQKGIKTEIDGEINISLTVAPLKLLKAIHRSRGGKKSASGISPS